MPGPPSIDVTFRPAVASDAICIGVLATQVFLDTYAPAGIRLALAQEVLQHLSTGAITAALAEPACTFVVAETAGHMIAFSQLTYGATHTLVAGSSPAALNRLYVQERFTGKGVGTALLHHTEALAAAHGASTLWLTAWAGNRRALTFYAVKGYQDVGETLYVFQGDEYENRVFTRELGHATPT